MESRVALCVDVIEIGAESEKVVNEAFEVGLLACQMQRREATLKLKNSI